jgi:nickel-dependent lactate racemase
MADPNTLSVRLAYGTTGLTVQLPASHTTVIQPRHTPGLPNERAAVHAALENPLSTQPLRQWLHPDSKVCITFTDSTRATPNERLIPWLLEVLDQTVPRSQITLLNQTGSHRANTPAELSRLLTAEVVRTCRTLNHDAHDASQLVQLGTTRHGRRALYNRHLTEADVRIVTGFIEPHFFAGFSGGPKGIVPGCAGLETIMDNHGPHHIASPQATFGMTHGNPLWEELCELALRVGPSFLLNVTLNEDRAITGVFAGDLLAAHEAGTQFVRQSAMQAVPTPFDLVITTNSGSPLDLNLYQGIKGISAAARILKPHGTIILACECREGVPPNSPFDRLLRSAPSPQALIQQIHTPGFLTPEQWQAQIQAQIQQHARVLVHSSLPDDTLLACHLEPCHDIAATANELLKQKPECRIAVLPYGPLTIPYISSTPQTC